MLLAKKKLSKKKRFILLFFFFCFIYIIKTISENNYFRSIIIFFPFLYIYISFKIFGEMVFEKFQSITSRFYNSHTHICIGKLNSMTKLRKLILKCCSLLIFMFTKYKNIQLFEFSF